MQGRSASSATWCASELSARPLPCELPRLQAGQGAGGEHFPWRSSSPWRAQHLDAHGRRPRNQDRATAPPWIVFSTLPRPRGPAASPCGPKPGPRVAARELSSSSGFRGLGTPSCRHKSPLKKKKTLAVSIGQWRHGPNAEHRTACGALGCHRQNAPTASCPTLRRRPNHDLILATGFWDLRSREVRSLNNRLRSVYKMARHIDRQHVGLFKAIQKKAPVQSVGPDQSHQHTFEA